jgi:Mg2+-importing ATPase
VRPHPQRLCGLSRSAHKETARAAINTLEGHGIRVKVVTGDNELVARKVCKEVGLSTEHVLLGREVEKLTDEQLADAVEKTTLFVRVSPAHKQRIITALQSRQHTIGFRGDGINDAPAYGRPTSTSASLPPWTSPKNRRT